MTLAPRWYREQQLREKIIPRNSYALDLMDKQDFINREQAIKKALNNQDFRYQLSQQENVNSLVKRLEEV